MSETLTRRQVAHLARVSAVEAGITEGHGARGRVSKSVVLAFLQGQPAKTVRQIASDLGVEISPKGKIKADELTSLTNFVANNLPK